MIMTNKKYLHDDISDSKEDQEKLKPDQSILNLPEIKDIPGAARSGKNVEAIPRDLTISSSDEEGDEIFDEEDTPEETEVSPLEKKLLSRSFGPAYEEDFPIDSIT